MPEEPSYKKEEKGYYKQKIDNLLEILIDKHRNKLKHKDIQTSTSFFDICIKSQCWQNDTVGLIGFELSLNAKSIDVHFKCKLMVMDNIKRILYTSNVELCKQSI